VHQLEIKGKERRQKLWIGETRGLKVRGTGRQNWFRKITEVGMKRAKRGVREFKRDFKRTRGQGGGGQCPE